MTKAPQYISFFYSFVFDSFSAETDSFSPRRAALDFFCYPVST